MMSHIRKITLAICVITALCAPKLAMATPAQIVTSPKGITAWLVEDHTNPLIAVSILFRNGASSDPADKVGLSQFASGMLDEGAGPYDSKAFQEKLATLNIQLGFSAGRDSFTGRLLTLTQNKDAAFNLLGLALTQPRFDAEPLSRMRGIFQAQLRQRLENPTSRASDLMRKTLFTDHVYSRNTKGTKDGINAITAADLKNFIKTRFTRDQLVISVVGDIDAATLSQLLDKTFAKLPATSHLPKVADIKPHLDGKIHTISMPVPQAKALFVQSGPSRNDPDWHGFQIMMYILGDGGFSSRLTEEVREKRGLAYSVSAGAQPLKHAPLVLGSVGTQASRVHQSLKIIQSEWKKMRDHGPTKEEVAKAKSYIIGSMPLRLNASASIASTLVALQYYHLPVDDLEHRDAVISAITAKDVQDIAKRWLTPDALTFFVVGEKLGAKK